MFGIRNVGGVAFFLFGTTFVWLTPMFAATEVDTSGTAWATVAVLATVTIVGFTVATGILGVLLLLRVPRLEHWVHGHVAAGH